MTQTTASISDASSDATSDATKIDIDARALKARLGALTERCQAAAMAVQSTVLVRQSGSSTSPRPTKVQEALVLAVADLNLLRDLCELAEESFTGLEVYTLSSDQRQDSFYGAVVGQAKMMVVGIANSLNVDEEIVVPACILHIGQNLDLIETVLARTESVIAEISA